MTPQEPTDSAVSTASLAALLDKDDATNRWIARHPKAGAALLEKLSHSSDRITRAVVAANPDTPPAVYLRLGAQFPSEFLANPMLDLLFLERPALLQELPDNLLVQVLRKPSCPQDFLVWAAGHASEKVQLAVAMNAKAGQQAIEKLHKSIYMAVKESVSHRQFMQVDSETAEPLFRQAVKDRLGSLSLSEAEKAWKNKDIGLAQLPYLSTPVRLIVAGMSEDQLVALSQEPSWIAQLARYPEYGIQLAVFRRPNTPVDLLEGVAKNPSASIRELMVVAKHVNTPVAVLEVLAKHKHYDVRNCVAENPNSPVAALAVLAKDIRDDVRNRVAENPNTPVAVLSVLAMDEFMWIRWSVARHPNTPGALLEVLAKDFWIAVAANPNTPVALLKGLEKDKSPNFRSCVAGHPNTPVAVLTVLARDKSADVRSGVAKLSNPPPASIEMMANDLSWDVRCAILGNPATPPALADAVSHALLYGDLRKDPWYRDALSKADAPTKAAVASDNLLFCAGKDPNRDVLSTRTTAKLMALCSGPFVTPERIARVSGSTDWLIRAAVARNAGTPPNLLKKLTADAHPLVAGLAKLALSATGKTVSEIKQASTALRIKRVAEESVAGLRKSRKKPSPKGQDLDWDNK